MANFNPINIYFDNLEQAAEWADAHSEVILTVWGKTQSGKVRASFILRRKYEEANASSSSVETVPTV